MGLAKRFLKTLVMGREDGLRARLRRKMGLDDWFGFHAGERARDRRGVRASGVAQTPLDALPVPEGFSAVLRQDELAPGELVEVMVDGVPVAVCNVDGTYYAVSNVCPHAGGPIGDGTLAGHTVVCPYHGWSFDVRDGRCFVDEALSIDTYEVRVTTEAVCVRLA
ncbi:MAG: Rieske 2Fe-2S domain-containing protein [Deltaproteobacteria bacterium]|nr:Rieske 2Fe-2S domain-containing protein [Deltaproteobacteria bacterium]